mgnify:CR=1 FL=1
MIKITTNMYENPLLPEIHQLYFLSKNFLEKCGLNTGLEIPFLEFERLVSEKILLAGKGREICGDCQWAYICHK